MMPKPTSVISLVVTFIFREFLQPDIDQNNIIHVDHLLFFLFFFIVILPDRFR
jgi:hypothetical protein